MKPIAIFGAGGFGREVAMLIRQINMISPEWKLAGFYDDAPGLQEATVGGLPVLGGIPELNALQQPLSLVLALGSPKVKKKVRGLITNPLISYPSLFHPGVVMSDDLKLGQGCIVCAGSILTVNIRLGDFVTINLNTTVGHDSVIESYSSLMPGVSVSGEVVLKEECYVGTGATIINGFSVGRCSIVGAGAVVNSHLPADCTAVGVPARVIKKRN